VLSATFFGRRLRDRGRYFVRRTSCSEGLPDEPVLSTSNSARGSDSGAWHDVLRTAHDEPKRGPAPACCLHSRFARAVRAAASARTDDGRRVGQPHRRGARACLKGLQVVCRPCAPRGSDVYGADVLRCSSRVAFGTSTGACRGCSALGTQYGSFIVWGAGRQ